MGQACADLGAYLVFVLHHSQRKVKAMINVARMSKPIRTATSDRSSDQFTPNHNPLSRFTTGEGDKPRYILHLRQGTHAW